LHSSALLECTRHHEGTQTLPSLITTKALSSKSDNLSKSEPTTNKISRQLSPLAIEFFPIKTPLGIQPSQSPTAISSHIRNNLITPQIHQIKTVTIKQTNIAYVTTVLSTSQNAHNTTQTDDPNISPTSTDCPPPPTTNGSLESTQQLFTIDKPPLAHQKPNITEPTLLALKSKKIRTSQAPCEINLSPSITHSPSKPKLFRPSALETESKPKFKTAGKVEPTIFHIKNKHPNLLSILQEKSPTAFSVSISQLPINHKNSNPLEQTIALPCAPPSLKPSSLKTKNFL
jgi:hypothetical protein